MANRSLYDSPASFHSPATEVNEYGVSLQEENASLRAELAAMKETLRSTVLEQELRKLRLETESEVTEEIRNGVFESPTRFTVEELSRQLAEAREEAQIREARAQVTIQLAEKLKFEAQCELAAVQCELDTMCERYAELVATSAHNDERLLTDLTEIAAGLQSQASEGDYRRMLIAAEEEVASLRAQVYHLTIEAAAASPTAPTVAEPASPAPPCPPGTSLALDSAVSGLHMSPGPDPRSEALAQELAAAKDRIAVLESKKLTEDMVQKVKINMEALASRVAKEQKAAAAWKAKYLTAHNALTAALSDKPAGVKRAPVTELHDKENNPTAGPAPKQFSSGVHEVKRKREESALFPAPITQPVPAATPPSALATAPAGMGDQTTECAMQ